MKYRRIILAKKKKKKKIYSHWEIDLQYSRNFFLIPAEKK